MPLSGPISGGGGGGAANIDTTVPVDGDILVGRTSTGKYMNGVLAVGSTKLAVTTGAGTISIDANEANFTLGNLGGILSLAKGGTNKNMTAANGGIVYSDADSMELLAPTATANQIVLSGSNAAPSWSSATYPVSTTVNQILYSSSINTIAGLSTDNSKVLITSATGVPSFSTNLHYDNTNTRLGIGAAATTYGLEVNKDTDNGAEIGRAHIGYGTLSDYAWFSHVDMVATTNYALLQNGLGGTFLNAAAGQTLSIRIDNTQVIGATSSAISITPDTTASGLFILNGNVAEGLTLSGTRTVVSAGVQSGIRTSATFDPVSNSNIFGFYTGSTINVTNAAVVTNTVIGCRNELTFPNTYVGATTAAYGSFSKIILGATMTGTITTAYGVAYVANGGADPGTVTTSYGLHIPKPDFGTNKYCAYLEGPVGIGNSTPTETLHVSGSESHKRVATAVSYIVLSTDYHIGVTSTAAPRTVTLPAAASTAVGRTIIIQDESGGADTNNITIDTAGGNINGASSFIIADSYGGATAVNNGTNWFIINNAVPRSAVQASQVQSWMGI